MVQARRDMPEEKKTDNYTYTYAFVLLCLNQVFALV